ncbi:DUF4168 domain-containing protein [Leptothermofonsia sichuanensis E412]|uniref:DUF4168 domain-containing protein n=1 Tax=Leptothermofonsia sichuanensis TaxID=2917832 RepID=UPI001CA74CA4|nr:DUF4168 domain-containing protein [Leptothermofonsia sichuanensis]QZZ21942.1 DUF4168 domain-containing protein [Leptothermofonsia sichuanensis E412]
MVKHILASCSLMLLLGVGSLPVQAQSPSPAPAQTAAPTKVSTEELKKFTSALKKALLIMQERDNQMVQAVQKEGLTEERFNEIHQSRQDPSKKPSQQVTSKEEQSYKQAFSQLVEIEKNTQAKMEKALESEGMNVARFNEILAQVQKDPSLQQEVRKLIQQ